MKRNNNNLILFFTLVTFLTSYFIYPQSTLAADDTGTNPSGNDYLINVDQNTLIKGYTVNAFNNNLKLSLDPGTLNEATTIEANKLADPEVLPWSINKLSSVYQFEFKNKQAYNNKHPFFIQLSYDKSSNNLKQVFFYDKNYNTWRPLPTKDYPKDKFVRSLIYLPYARIAVFEHPDILSSGDASWYKYRNGLFAASPDFPKNSILRVYNTNNNKFIDVKINDFGPNRSLHPSRVLDIDKTAFARIAPLGQGTVSIRIEPLYIAPENNKTLGMPSTGVAANPALSSKAAVIIDSSNSIIWSKNATSSLPVASLTKLIAAKVFLDTKPDLKKIVAYSKADEEYNYKYASKWEVARLKVDDGETLTVNDLLYSALIGSANNAVESLVRASGLERDEFIKKMNISVQEWGASSTVFVEPTGLSPQNMSSALDYAIISNNILKNPLLEKISSTRVYKFTTVNTKKPHTITNSNQLIALNRIKITGSKTGYLDEAGYCLMTKAVNSKKQIIVVTLGAPTRAISFNETEELARYGLNKLQ